MAVMLALTLDAAAIRLSLWWRSCCPARHPTRSAC